MDPRAPKNLSKLNENLTDIHHVMKKNIEEVLQRGEKLDVIGSRATSLAEESKKFKKMSQWANIQYMIRTYGPFAAVGLLILLILWWRLF